MEIGTYVAVGSFSSIAFDQVIRKMPPKNCRNGVEGNLTSMKSILAGSEEEGWPLVLA
jgi:hypothetical protein